MVLVIGVEGLALLILAGATVAFDRGAEFVTPVVALICGGTAMAFYSHRRRVLRRFIRADLGTHCSRCDYDLRGAPPPRPGEVARCPECGQTIRLIDLRAEILADGESPEA